MTVQFLIVAAGLGKIGTYYHAGERLGFAGEPPHTLALMTMVIAAAGLCASTGVRKILLFAVAAVPTAFTGVRSALLGLLAALIVFLAKSDAKMRALLVLAVIIAVAFATGALDVPHLADLLARQRILVLLLGGLGSRRDLDHGAERLGPRRAVGLGARDRAALDPPFRAPGTRHRTDRPQ